MFSVIYGFIRFICPYLSGFLHWHWVNGDIPHGFNAGEVTPKDIGKKIDAKPQ